MYKYHKHARKEEQAEYAMRSHVFISENVFPITWQSNIQPLNLEEVLSAIAYKVTQTNGTEPAFKNEYWDNKREGIYVDIVSGEPLFCSLDKYDSGTGWPSFTKPIHQSAVVIQEDPSPFSGRIEVRSKYADSHLGHVFPDGPQEQGGCRYCINSAALRFIPKEELKDTIYESFLSCFSS